MGDLCILKHACVFQAYVCLKCVGSLTLFYNTEQIMKNKLSLDEDIQFESDGGIHIDKYIKVEKGAVYNDQGYVTVNNYPDDATIAERSKALDEDYIHMAIVNLYDATDEKGKKVFAEQGQWYAVYRVLKEYCNYPDRMTDFVNLIRKNGWDEAEPLCRYDSIRNINKSLPLLAAKVGLWQQYKSTNEKYAKQCAVAEKLMKLLELI